MKNLQYTWRGFFINLFIFPVNDRSELFSFIIHQNEKSLSPPWLRPPDIWLAYVPGGRVTAHWLTLPSLHISPPVGEKEKKRKRKNSHFQWRGSAGGRYPAFTGVRGGLFSVCPGSRWPSWMFPAWRRDSEPAFCNRMLLRKRLKWCLCSGGIGASGAL